ncbi:hypothetical protein KP509_02G057500 [Ceratopteris richardii]|uniref:PRA1 family protein n=1 Tax=Ceratopteris richardii TaxID=49495 RepID=A0A8T2V680_CERRI|nr:hypothetical protein KP509_02G057500 [Ceratopteris richardii]
MSSPDVVGGAPMALASTPAARAFLARLSEGAKHAFSTRRPWMELADISAFARPESSSEVANRIRKNWSFFRVNYALILSAIVVITFLSNPTSLFFLCFVLAAWIYMYLVRTSSFVAFGRTLSERELLILMSVCSIIFIFLTNVGSLLISAVLIGCVVISVHAASRVPDELFTDEDGGAGHGFMSFISSVPKQPAVVTHV